MVKLLRIRRVIEVTGKPRSSIYADMAAGKFPQPVKIGAKAVAWPESDLEAWLASCQRRAPVEAVAA